MRAIMRIALGIVVVSVAACGSDEDAGRPPELSQLTFGPAMIGVGAQTTVSGTMAFTDEDGDLAELGIEVVLPDGSRQSIPMTDLQGVGSMTEGQLAWVFAIAPPMAGSYVFELWVTDAGDHASNRLSGTLVAE